MSLQPALAQRPDQPVVVTITFGQCRASRQHNARMEEVGPRQFHHLGRIVSMKAIEVGETGGPEVLTYIDKEQPSPGPGEVVIKAEAIGVNFLDTYFRSGQYPRELPFIVGEDVAALSVGDRVVTAQADGAYAEYCVAPADFCAYVPEGVSPDAAAASLLKGMTAHYLITSVYPVQEGDAVLVHAGAG